MAERILSPLTYLMVLGVLVALTVLTTGVSFLPLSGAGHIVCGLIIAVCKASLVVLFFMHALHSPRLTWVVILAALFWLGIMLGLTYSDYFSRSLLPYPGH